MSLIVITVIESPEPLTFVRFFSRWPICSFGVKQSGIHTVRQPDCVQIIHLLDTNLLAGLKETEMQGYVN